VGRLLGLKVIYGRSSSGESVMHFHTVYGIPRLRPCVRASAICICLQHWIEQVWSVPLLIHANVK